jgi:hypothetical protein
MASRKVSELTETTEGLGVDDLLAVAKSDGGGGFNSRKITGETFIAGLIEPGGGLELNDDGDKLKVSSGDSSFQIYIDNAGSDTGDRTFTKVGSVTTINEPFKTVEGTIEYINANITAAIPIDILVTSNIFMGKGALGAPLNASATPIRFANRAARLYIDIDGHTITSRFNNNFPLEIGIEFDGANNFRLRNGTIEWSNVNGTEQLVRANNNAVLQVNDLDIVVNGSSMDAFFSTIQGARILTLKGFTENYTIRMTANLSTGSNSIFRAATSSTIQLANTTQDSANDWKYQIVFNGVPWKFNELFRMESGGIILLGSTPFTREGLYAGVNAIQKQASADPPEILVGNLNAIMNNNDSYEDQGAVIQSIVYVGTNVNIGSNLVTGAQMGDTTISETGNNANLLPSRFV